MISSELLSILCCPETRQSLTLASSEELSKISALIAAGSLKNRKGDLVSESIDGALIRQDQKWAYIIRQDIPIMLIDEAIPL